MKVANGRVIEASANINHKRSYLKKKNGKNWKRTAIREKNIDLDVRRWSLDITVVGQNLVDG